MIKKQFTLYIENRPGALEVATGALAAAKVSIEGISVAETTDVALVQVVVDNAAAARKALKRAKLPFAEQDVAVMQIPHRPGSLHAVASQLAKAGVNINYLYCTAGEHGTAGSTLVISAESLELIEKITIK